MSDDTVAVALLPDDARFLVYLDALASGDACFCCEGAKVEYADVFYFGHSDSCPVHRIISAARTALGDE